ncbi:rhodanese-like domain-containing protein [Derxia lacustris]|uniref:rhodanese-like domain-containing protein n=1 Tax=Derxia lacustris TaxID=764842 RepID=UPI000A178604|nr:rhodanese-like domain-containing protein [Derxia lacustris]
MQQMQPTELAARLADTAAEQPLLVDVRETWEVELCQIPGSISIPMNTIPARVGELDPDREIVCICHHGGRSAQVAFWLERNGFTRVINLAGGVHEWAGQVDPTMRRY